MKIEETVIENDFHVETKDHYGVALEILDFLSSFGDVYEKKNEYLSDGPRTKTEIEADVINLIDKFSRISLYIYIDGEANGSHYLHVSVKGAFVTEIRESEGFFVNAFHSFYMSNLLQPTRKSAEKEISRIVKDLEKFIKSKNELHIK